MKSLIFQVTFLVEPDEGRWHAWAPQLKGLHADGKSKAEALQRAQELASLYLETLIEEGNPIPIGRGAEETQDASPQATTHQEIVAVTVFTP